MICPTGPAIWTSQNGRWGRASALQGGEIPQRVLIARSLSKVGWKLRVLRGLAPSLWEEPVCQAHACQGQRGTTSGLNFIFSCNFEMIENSSTMLLRSHGFSGLRSRLPIYLNFLGLPGLQRGSRIAFVLPKPTAGGEIVGRLKISPSAASQRLKPLRGSGPVNALYSSGARRGLTVDLEPSRSLAPLSRRSPVGIA
jgi:hypothetical protein